MTPLSTPNSPNFNERGWQASQSALALANAPKGALTLRNPISGAKVSGNVDKLKATRFDARIETAKVVNVETVTDTKAAELLGLSKLTCKKLRAACKARGFKGYSKLKKAELLTMLG